MGEDKKKKFIENYQEWRRLNSGMFGDVFSNAFSGNVVAQINLTSALINISQRKFKTARNKLVQLESVCSNEFDETALCYFQGICFH